MQRWHVGFKAACTAGKAGHSGRSTHLGALEALSGHCCLLRAGECEVDQIATCIFHVNHAAGDHCGCEVKACVQV